MNTKIKILYFLISIILTSCLEIFTVDECTDYHEIKAFANEVLITDNLRLVGFGGGTHKGMSFSLTFLSPETPTLDEARAIFYDISIRFLQLVNLDENLCNCVEDRFFTIENLSLKIIFNKAPGCISAASNGYEFNRNPLQYVYFYTYINENEKFGDGSDEPYEQVKNIVESQRALNHPNSCGF